MQCAVCDKAFDTVQLGESQVAYCSSCTAYWLDQTRQFAVFQYWLAASSPAPRHRRFKEMNPTNGYCPVCNIDVRPMAVPHTGVQVLLCQSCRGIWLYENAIPFLLRWWKGTRDSYKPYTTTHSTDRRIRLEEGELTRAVTFQLEDLNPVRRFPAVVISIIMVCTLALFVAPLLQSYPSLLFVPSSFFNSPVNNLYSLFTSLFLHIDPTHLIGNMYFLYLFGDNIEDRIGHWKFGLAFLSLGTLASLGHAFLTQSPNIQTLGASGAISGIMGGYLFLYPNVRMKTHKLFLFIPFAIEFPAWVYIGLWFVFLQLFYSVSQSNVAWIAHLSGLFSGYVLFFIMKKLDLL